MHAAECPVAPLACSTVPAHTRSWRSRHSEVSHLAPHRLPFRPQTFRQDEAMIAACLRYTRCDRAKAAVCIAAASTH